MSMYNQLRTTTNKNQFYNDFFFDTEEECLAFWKMAQTLKNISSSGMWLELKEKRVTLLSTTT